MFWSDTSADVNVTKTNRSRSFSWWLSTGFWRSRLGKVIHEGRYHWRMLKGFKMVQVFTCSSRIVKVLHSELERFHALSFGFEIMKWLMLTSLVMWIGLTSAVNRFTSCHQCSSKVIIQVCADALSLIASIFWAWGPKPWLWRTMSWNQGRPFFCGLLPGREMPRTCGPGCHVQCVYPSCQVDFCAESEGWQMGVTKPTNVLSKKCCVAFSCRFPQSLEQS